MIRTFIEELGAIASLSLFIGCIAVWAQLFTHGI
jgi:hypothetical protein